MDCVAVCLPESEDDNCDGNHRQYPAHSLTTTSMICQSRGKRRSFNRWCFVRKGRRMTHRSLSSTSCNWDLRSDVSDIGVGGNSPSFSLAGLLIRKMHGSQYKNTTRTYEKRTQIFAFLSSGNIQEWVYTICLGKKFAKTQKKII